MTYEIVPVIPDTPEWEQERLNSIGASEVPGILGLSEWSTPLSVYNAKKGVANDFDPELSYIGHAEETTIEGWIRKFRHHDIPLIKPAFMARSVEAPWLHASLDRVADEQGILCPIQMKTAHQFAAKEWDGDVPLWVQAQVQTEIFVLDAPHGWAVVFVGGRKFTLVKIGRDQEWIDEYLLPVTRDFWWHRVLADLPPEPSTLGEVNSVYPSDPGTAIEASDNVLDAAGRREVLLSDIKEQKAEADALTLAIAQYMGSAETLLTPDGPVLTYKTQKGRRAVTDFDELELQHPEFVTRGNDFKVMRTSTRRNQK